MGTALNRYEFYNYSPNPPAGSFPPNPQEAGNQYFVSATNNNVSNEAQIYIGDYFNTGYNNGINIQNELYTLHTGSAGSTTPTAQVLAAINNAFNNYILYLHCSGQLSNNNGRPAQTGPGCPAESCPSCSTTLGTCPPTYQP